MQIYSLLLLTDVCSMQSVSMPALSRLLEAVAKSIKHATAMSTILATEIFQTRRDAVLAHISSQGQSRPVKFLYDFIGQFQPWAPKHSNKF